VNQLCANPRIEGADKNLLHIVQRSVNRMLRLVNQMMDFNKLENDTLRLQVKRADLIACLQRQVGIFRVNADDKGIDLNTYGLEDTFLMWLDEDKVEKIFNNLMSNALKFTPQGGKISVGFDVIDREKAARLFGLSADGRITQYVKVSVANTGQSIPEDKIEKIFERYYQIGNQAEGTYNWGTGIGLYYARSLAVLHHGQLKASQSEEGSGAVFTFVLPVNDAAYAEDERATEQSNQSEAFPLAAASQPAENKTGNPVLDTLLTGEYDCAATRRTTRKGEPPLRSWFARKFYQIINKMSDTEIVDGARDFRLMSRKMTDAVLSMAEYNRFSKGIFSWVGFKTKWFDYENIERVAGTTKWNFWGLFKYSIEGIVGFSTTPLLIAAGAGVLFCILAFIGILFVVVRALMFGDPTSGWPSMVCIILLCSGVQLFCTGIVGEYLAKTYLEVKHRPIYIVAETEEDKK